MGIADCHLSPTFAQGVCGNVSMYCTSGMRALAACCRVNSSIATFCRFLLVYWEGKPCGMGRHSKSLDIIGYAGKFPVRIVF